MQFLQSNCIGAWPTVPDPELSLSRNGTQLLRQIANECLLTGFDAPAMLIESSESSEPWAQGSEVWLDNLYFREDDAGWNPTGSKFLGFVTATGRWSPGPLVDRASSVWMTNLTIQGQRKWNTEVLPSLFIGGLAYVAGMPLLDSKTEHDGASFLCNLSSREGCSLSKDVCFKRKSEIDQELVKTIRVSSFTRMAQHHHHDSISQHVLRFIHKLCTNLRFYT